MMMKKTAGNMMILKLASYAGILTCMMTVRSEKSRRLKSRQPKQFCVQFAASAPVFDV
jgi:hypothetical protein